MASFFTRYYHRISGFSRNARLFIIASTTEWVAASLFGLLFNLYLLALGYTTGFLGLLISLSSVASVVFALPIGRIAAVVGHRRVMLGTGVLTAAVMVAQVEWPVPLILVTGTILAAAQGTALSVVGGPFMTDNSTPEERPHLFTIQGALGMASGVAGNALGGALPVLIAAATGWRPQDALVLKYALLAGMSVLFVPVIWPLLAIREPAHVSAPGIPAVTPSGMAAARAAGTTATTASGTEQGKAPAARGNTPARERDAATGSGPIAVLGRILGLEQPTLVFKLAVPALITSLGAGLIVPFFNVFYKHLGGEPGTIGLIFSVQSIVTALAYLVAPVLAARWGKVHMVSYVQAASVPFLLAMALSPGLWWAAGWGLVRNVLMNMANPISSTFSMEVLKPGERAAANGLFTVAWSLGWALASPVAGLLMESISYRAPYLPAAVLYLAGAGVNLYLFGHYDHQGHSA